MVDSKQGNGITSIVPLNHGNKQLNEVKLLDTDAKHVFDDFIRLQKTKENINIKPLLLLLQHHLTSIMRSPYKDANRILDVTIHEKLLKNEGVKNILIYCGFVQGVDPKSLVFPYDNQLEKIVKLNDLLEHLLNQLQENLDVDIDDFINFPCINKYLSLFQKDLSCKNAKPDRSIIHISYHNVMDIKNELKIHTLEEYVYEYGVNTEKFQSMCLRTFTSPNKLRKFYTLVRNLWVECVVLRKVFLFVNQSFKDDISTSALIEKDSKSAKIAQLLLKIDPIQARSLQKMNGFKVDCLWDIIKLCLERRELINTKNDLKLQKLEESVNKAILPQDRGESFWSNIEIIAVEKISGATKINKPPIDEKKALWLSENPVEVEPDHLSAECNERLQKYFPETFDEKKIETLHNLLHSDENVKKENKFHDKIMNPLIWFFKKELEFNLAVYNSFRNLCLMYNCPMRFDIKENLHTLFKAFIGNWELPHCPPSSTIVKIKPSIMAKAKKINKDVMKNDQNKQLMIKDEISATNDLINTKKIQDAVKNLQVIEEEWKTLYTRLCPPIMHACCYNNHAGLLRKYIKDGGFINMRDHSQKTPLHICAGLGIKDCLLILLENKADIDAKDEEGMTPLNYAIKNKLFSEPNNIVESLLNHGAAATPEDWEKLLDIATKEDNDKLYTIAHKRNINLLLVDANKYSLHYAVKLGSINIAIFYRRNFDMKVLKYLCLSKDKEGFTVLGRAKHINRQDIINVIQPIVNEINIEKNVEIIKEANDKVTQNAVAYHQNIEKLKNDFEKDIEEHELRIKLLKEKQSELIKSQKIEKEQIQQNLKESTNFFGESLPNTTANVPSKETHHVESPVQHIHSILLEDNTINEKNIQELNEIKEELEKKENELQFLKLQMFQQSELLATIQSQIPTEEDYLNIKQNYEKEMKSLENKMKMIKKNQENIQHQLEQMREGPSNKSKSCNLI